MAKTPSLSERLRQCREALGITQMEVATRALIHPSQYARYEAGTNEPTLRIARRLASALELSAPKASRVLLGHSG